MTAPRVCCIKCHKELSVETLSQHYWWSQTCHKLYRKKLDLVLFLSGELDEHAMSCIYNSGIIYNCLGELITRHSINKHADLYIKRWLRPIAGILRIYNTDLRIKTTMQILKTVAEDKMLRVTIPLGMNLEPVMKKLITDHRLPINATELTWACMLEQRTRPQNDW